MGIKRLVEKEEMDAIKAKSGNGSGLVSEVIDKLKGNPGKSLEVDSADLGKLKNKIKYIKNLGTNEDVNHLNILVVKDEKDGKVTNVYVEWLDKVPETVVKNKGSGKGKKDKKAKAQDNPVKDDKQKNDNPHAHTVEGAGGKWQTVSNGAGIFAGMKEQMMKSIENMPVQMLSMPLAQYQGILAEKQQQLSAPGTTEDAAGKTKEDIQVLEEVIAAIRKKMGQ
jgi:hypothetical protein